MRLGMMQPYFFPYLGYFSLIHATDHWVVFDTAQYIRRGWVNRNRVLSKGAEPWKYVRVPVRKSSSGTSIRDTMIDQRQDWRQQLLNDLDGYSTARAPRFDTVRAFLGDVLDLQTDSLCELLMHTLTACCLQVGLPFTTQTFSEINVGMPEAPGPGDWALQTADHLRADAYINPPGGRQIFDQAAFRERNIRLQFLEPKLPPYGQGVGDFQAGLSIIDALMWNDPAAVLQMIGEYELVNP